jgi:hypothetical protein
MKVAIIGSRNFGDYQIVNHVITRLRKAIQVTHIVHGGAHGADSLGSKYAKENSLAEIAFKPDWDTYGNRAGYLRNIDIVAESDLILAFWDGQSKGTQHSFILSKKTNKRCIAIVSGINYKSLNLQALQYNMSIIVDTDYCTLLVN